MVKSTGNNSQQGSDQVLLLHIHQNIFFFFKISSCVQKEEIHTDLEQLEGE